MLVVLAVTVSSALTASTLLREDEAAAPRAGRIDAGRSGPVVPLPSSGWRPGDTSMLALMSGVVTVDPDGCVFARPAAPGRRRAGLLWPEGFATRREGDGRVSILDGSGRVVLREGERFSSGGGGVAHRTDFACARGTTDTWAMHGVPTRIG